MRRRFYGGRFASAVIPPPSPPPPPPPPPPSFGVPIGVNAIFFDYGERSAPFNDYARGGAQAVDTGTIAPTDLDANGGLKQLPAGASIAYRLLNSPNSPNAPVVATWDGEPTFVSCDNSTSFVPDYPNKTATFTITNDQSADIFPLIRWGYPADPTKYPRTLAVKDPGASGLLNPVFKQDIQRFDGPLRFLHWNTYAVEANFGQNTAFPGAQVTAANRVKPTTVDWFGPQANGGKYDGPPLEILAQAAAEVVRDAYWNVPWNASNDYITLAAITFLNTHCLVNGKKLIVASSNEDWNGGTYGDLIAQISAEATAEGLNTLQRHCERHCQVMALIEAVFVGHTSLLDRRLEGQHVIPANAATALDYTTPSSGTVLSHTDSYATAPYIAPAIAVGYTGDAAVFFAAARTSSDEQIAFGVQNKAICIARGIRYETYEAGWHERLTDGPYHAGIYTDSRSYDETLYFLQKWQMKVGVGLTWHVHVHKGLNGYLFGLKMFQGQAISKAATPRFKAIIDYKAGLLLALPLTGTFAAGAGAPNGYVVGTPELSAPNSTYSLANNDGGRLAVNATTAEITVANTALMTASLGRSFTIRDTNPGYPAPGYVDTAFSYDIRGELVANGGFTGNATGWTLGSGVAYGTNNITATGAGSIAAQNVGFVIGKMYRVTLDYTSTHAANLRIANGSTASTNIVDIKPVIADGASHSLTFSFTAAGSWLRIEADGDFFSGTIDNVSAVETF